MIDLTTWMPQYLHALDRQFGDRVCFVGLQGSYSRGEATESSDLDIVLILDALTAEDIHAYSALMDTLPHREKLCGFLSGKDELRSWEPSDLFTFYHDTTPIRGNLETLLTIPGDEAVKRAIRIGACNLYHGCVHNMLYGKKERSLAGLYKSAAFILQAQYFRRTGSYVRHLEELIPLLPQNERAILQTAQALKQGAPVNFPVMSEALFLWLQNLIKEL